MNELWLLGGALAVWFCWATISEHREEARRRKRDDADARQRQRLRDDETQERHAWLERRAEQLVEARRHGNLVAAEDAAIIDGNPGFVTREVALYRIGKYAPDGRLHEVLGTPDRILDRLHSGPMKLYSLARIRHQERHDEVFREWRRQAAGEAQRQRRRLRVAREARALVSAPPVVRHG